jgi:adenine phosphoribosyltransferase
MFRDITPLLADSGGFELAITSLAALCAGMKTNKVIGVEARGFIFAAPVAVRIGAGFVPVRKPGKLPHDKHSFSYDLEYGSDTLEMHKDGVSIGQRVLVVDDLLATGGTVEACCKLLSNIQVEIVGCLFCIELSGLNGRSRLAPHQVVSLLTY